jgi:hypothetical protein
VGRDYSSSPDPRKQIQFVPMPSFQFKNVFDYT